MICLRSNTVGHLHRTTTCLALVPGKGPLLQLASRSLREPSIGMCPRGAICPTASRFSSGGYTRHHMIDGDDTQEGRDVSQDLPDMPGKLDIPVKARNVTRDVDSSDPKCGAFQRIPMVSPSHEIIETALKRAERVGYNKKLKNDGARAKNRAARQLDTLMKELTAPLGKYEDGFIYPDELHPFERALLSLSVGEEKYLHAVDGVKSLRKSVVGVAKGYAGRCSKSPTKKEALDLRDEGFANVDSTYKRYSYILDELKEIAKSLRRLPVVDPGLSTVALVGAPNVGKSSLVQLLSSGLPEVQNYPFTTRSIKMGHFFVNGHRCQVTDTPGLLYRGDDDRNDMEKLTLASLQYLRTSVLFVIDLTGECGTSLIDQWRIREELLTRFPEKPWIDVFSKSDILREQFIEADHLIKTGAFETIAHDIEHDKKSKLEPAELACMIPNASRVSSMSGDGIDELKSQMLGMMNL